MKRPFQSYVLLIATKTLKGKKIVSVITLLKNILNVKHTIIEDFNIVTNDEGTDILEVNIRPYKSFQNRCPICGKKCSIYDKIQHDVLGEHLILQVLLLSSLVILVE